MARRRTKVELEAEFERLVAQIEAFAILFNHPQISPQLAPHTIARHIREVAGLSAAIEGCKQAINDSLETVLDAPGDQQSLIDARLVSVGAPRLHVLLAGRVKTLARLLKRGALKTETEYYLLKGVLDDADAPITSKERERAGSMLAKFERGLGGAV